MGKAKSKKKKHRKKLDVEELFFHIIMITIMLFFCISGIQNWIVLAKWDTGGVIEYTGTYTFSKYRTWRATIYKFKLDNGDTIFEPNIITGNTVKIINKEPILTFRYVICKDIYPNTFGEHSCTSIMSADKSVVFLNEDDSREGLLSSTILEFVLLLLILSIYLFCLYLKYLPLIEDKIKKYKRHKKKQKEKMQKQKLQN